MLCIDRSGAYCFSGVCMSVCLKLNLLTFSYNFHTIQVTMLIFDGFRQYPYRQGQGPISKSDRFGSISVSQTHLVFYYINKS